MTVAELIEMLKKAPQDAPVKHRHCDLGIPFSVEEEDVKITETVVFIA
jgi:hypothetical protein